MRQVNDFHIGDVLRTAFSVYSQNLLAFSLVAAIGLLPLFFLDLHYGLLDWNPAEHPDDPQPPFWGMLVSGIANLAQLAWVSAALTSSVVRILRTGRVHVLDALPQIVGVFPRVLIVAALSGLGIAAGTLLFIVPGIVLLLMWWVARPVAVVEGRFASALSRSNDLTRGYKGQLLALLVVVVAISAVPNVLLQVTLYAGAPAIAPFVQALVSVVIASYVATVDAVVYHDLRVLKEGPDSNAIAKVFE